jgi:putative acetyltransferase
LHKTTEALAAKNATCRAKWWMTAHIRIRPFLDGDGAVLFDIFYSAVHEIASANYTLEQLAAWAPPEIELTAWSKRLRRIQPHVVEVNGAPAAYADLQANGYIDHFYVGADVARQGVGSRLMRHLEGLAAARKIPELWADVSCTAEPFFAKHGFQIERRNEGHMIRGVNVPNTRMRKALRHP